MRKILLMSLVAGGVFLGRGVAGAVDPVCVSQARSDFLSCKNDCRSTYRDDKFRCRNVDPTCGNACLAGRERCLEPYLQVLTDCVDGCNATLLQGKQDCATQCSCTLGPNCQSNCCNAGNACYNTCLDPKQVDAFICRDNCREAFHTDTQLQDNIKNCRASFRACVQACPPAS
jgi:hypothetical protein